jgi:hypothetical protein
MYAYKVYAHKVHAYKMYVLRAIPVHSQTLRALEKKQ